MKTVNESADNTNQESQESHNHGGFGNNQEQPKTPSTFKKILSGRFTRRNNQILSNFIEVGRAILEEEGVSDLIKLDPIDRTTHMLGMDSVIVSTKLGQATVCCIVGLTNTAGEISPHIVKSHGETIHITNYPQDINTYDKALQTLGKIVKQLFGSVVEASPLYREIKNTDSDSDEFANEVMTIIRSAWISVAVRAADYILRTNPPISQAQKEEFLGNTINRFSIRAQCGAGAVVEVSHEKRAGLVMDDPTGIPANPDMIFTAYGRDSDKDRPYDVETSQIASTGISVDLMNAGVPHVDADGRVLPNQHAKSQTQWMYPIFNIDSIETTNDSLSSLLMGLITGLTPICNTANLSHLYPFVVDKADLRTEVSKMSHFGGMATELSFLHEKEKDIGDNHTECLTWPIEQKLEMLSNCIRTKPRIMMTISSLHHNFGVTNVLRKAAHRFNGNGYDQNPGSQEAYDYIYNECNRMTGNKFGEKFKYGKPICITTGSLRPIGRFTSPKDGPVNINKITYMYLQNAFRKNPELLESLSEYTNFLYNPNAGSPRYRLEGMTQYLRANAPILGIQNLEILGYGEQIEISAEAIGALITAFADHEVGIPVNIPDLGYVINNNKGRAFFDDYLGGSFGGFGNIGSGSTTNNSGFEAGRVSNDFSVFNGI